MKLTRNTTKDGRGKYALVRLDKIRIMEKTMPGVYERITKALDELAGAGVLEYGEKGSEEEFFVLKLKDYYTAWALEVYANVVGQYADDALELSREIAELHRRAIIHPNRKCPTFQ